ncbi:alpha/beta hydrolase [Acinetobacter sp. ANC 4218]|uniref:alpha/beta fold hydrolase n=1 Tax=Acinetobacter sp. ANC 4218 TaxID=1977880 RepID=UPI000A32B2D4|nr:alpha/beta hydrolase [Acinetobacter sp. ANC 4218]OTG72919.1 alpha/beta hydrolase [Acinetobacter sp. ANC 4218]
MAQMLTTTDGTSIYYKDWGEGPVVVFSHGWPLSSDAFEDQMLFLAEHGYRVIAFDRRGHGRSSQPWAGHNIDQYAQDMHQLIEYLGLTEFALVGHSTGGAVVTRYTAKYGQHKVTKLALIAAVTPLMIKRDDYPDGVDSDVFDEMRANLLANRADFYLDFAKAFYGYDKLLNKTSEGVIQNFWRIAMQGSIKAHYDCIHAFSETDLRDDLTQITVPTLVLYGTADDIVPPGICSQQTVKLLKQGVEEQIKGAPHGLCTTHKNEVSFALKEFLAHH